MTLDKNSEEYKFMCDYWKLMKEFWEVQNTEKWLFSFHKALNELSKKYSDNKFAQEHLFLFARLQEDK